MQQSFSQILRACSYNVALGDHVESCIGRDVGKSSSSLNTQSTVITIFIT